MRSKYKSLGLLLIAGLLVRFWAMRWPPFLIDMNDWIAWGERVLAVGPRHFYSETVFSDYTPGYIYVMWLTAWIKQTFFAAASVETYYFLYRLPSILFDLGTTTLIYITVEQALEKRFAQPGGPTKKRKRRNRINLKLAIMVHWCRCLQLHVSYSILPSSSIRQHGGN